MPLAYTLLLFAHVAALTVWVGGMFVMHLAVRPAAAELLQPPQRLPLMAAILQRFFRWVALAVVVIVASGFAMILMAGGFRVAHPSVHWMLVLGLIMSAIYGHIRFVPFTRLQRAVAAGDLPAAGMALASVRRWVSINLALGMLTIAVATVGRALL